MNIGKYVSSLLPNFSRSTIEEDIRILKEDISENTLPPFEAAAEFFNQSKFTSKECLAFDKAFQNSIDIPKDIAGNYVYVTYRSIKRALDAIRTLEEKLDKIFGKDVAGSSMTYARANVLQFIEAVTFANKYARKLLLWTYNEEKKANGRTIGEPFTKAELAWLKENRNAYFAVIKVISHKPSEIASVFSNIPDMIVVPEEVSVAQQTVGAAKLDPLRMGILPLWMNPIYHIRMAVTEYQVERYRAGQEEKRALEFRLMALKELRNGEADAKLEQQIEYTENRLKKLNYKLAKFEES